MLILSLSILVLAFGASIIRRPFDVKLIRAIFYFSIIAVFSLLVYYSYQQYQIWLSDELAKNFIHEETEIGVSNIKINYFIFYAATRFFAPYIISLIAAVLFLFSAQKLNKKYEERFFEPEEPWFGALAIFLVGWPGALFYFVGLILLYLIIHASYFMFYVSMRIPLYYLWLPFAIIVIIVINEWLMNLGVWKLLKI